MAKCIQCMRGMCLSCMKRGCNCTHAKDNSTTEDTSDKDVRESSRPRRNKPDAALTDQQSTGRKRAARMYPLNRTASCEWRESIKAGGGDQPILGCVDGLQQARHHGPDKNTLNNEPGNVHRICHTCHNRWHAANDPDYDPNKKLRD